MLCRSCGVELRLGVAIAEGLGEQLLFSVNTKKVQSKFNCKAYVGVCFSHNKST